jgi:uncharacterized protein (DUF433 family)
VVIDPEIMWGTPCLAGSRLPAQALFAMVDSGAPWERIVQGWPWLTPQHVKAARAWLADSRKSLSSKQAAAKYRPDGQELKAWATDERTGAGETPCSGQA